MKKIFVFIIIFSGILGCCGEQFPRWTIKDITLRLRDNNGVAPQNGEIFGDSINLYVQFSPKFVFENASFSNPFINSALATSCPEDGEEGMSDSVKTIIITSDMPFNNFNANESLNDIVVLGNEVSIGQWTANTKLWTYSSSSGANLRIREKPILNKEHKFKVQIEMESGAIISGETERIIWN